METLTLAMSLTNYHERTVGDYILMRWTAVACDSVSMRATPLKLSTTPPAGRVQPQGVMVVINETLIRRSTADSPPFYRSFHKAAPDVSISSRRIMARDQRQSWKDQLAQPTRVKQLRL